MYFIECVSLHVVYLLNGQLLFDTGCHSGRVLGHFSVSSNVMDRKDLIIH
jgi:hypothetical protein